MVLKVFSQGTYYFLKAKNTTRLYRLSQKVVEKERALPVIQITNSDTGWVTFDKPDDDFRWRIVKGPATEAGLPGLLKMDICVEGPYYHSTNQPKPDFKQFRIISYASRCPFNMRKVIFAPLIQGKNDGSFWVIQHSL